LIRRLLSFKSAYKHVRAGFGRAALSVLAVMVGVALVVAVQIMNAATLDSFLDVVEAVGGRAALTISAPDGATFDEGIASAVKQVAGVKLAVPLVQGVAFPDDGSGELLTVFGIDVIDEPAVRVYRMAGTEGIIEDPLIFLSQLRSVVLCKSFAERRGLDVGSGIDLVTPSGVKPFTVRGLLDEREGMAQAFVARTVLMDLYAAQRNFTADGQINRIDVVVDGDRVDEVKSALSAVLPAGLRVEEPAFRKDLVRRSASGLQSLLVAFALLAVGAGFIICYSRLRAVFEARTAEVGLLRAVGLRRSVVFGELIKESLLLGLLGTLMGIPVGVLIGRYGLPYVATTMALQLRLPVTAPRFVFDSRALLGAAVGIIAAVGAATVPSLRLARTSPVVALTMRNREYGGSQTFMPWGLRPLLLVFVAAGILWQLAAKSPALGLLTTALIVFATCALAAPLVSRWGRLLERIWLTAFGPAGRLASAQLGRRPRLSGLTVAMIATAIGVVFFIGTLEWSFERTLVSRLTESFRAQLMVVSSFVGGGYRASPLEDAIITEIARVPGVLAASGEQAHDITYHEDSVVLQSNDPNCFADVRVCNWPLDRGALNDALGRVARGEAVLISRSVAYKHRLRPGDVVELTAPTGTHQFQIAGVAASEPENAIEMSRDLYRRLWNDPYVWLIHVAIIDGADPSVVGRNLTRGFGERYRLQVRTSAQLIDFFSSQVRAAFSSLYITEAITLLLVLIGIGDTFASTVLERTREIGMMRAVGLRRLNVFFLIMLEGLALACLGVVLAFVCGLGLASFWARLQFPALIGWQIDLHMPAAFLAATGALTILLSVSGVFAPSLRAAHLRVMEALRYE